MAEQKKDSKTDDRAREATQHPLETARRSGPLPGLHGLSWAGPIAVVVVVLIALAIFVAVLM